MNISLHKARKRLFKKLDDGINCPCCGQFAKRYRLPLNANMAIFLIDLVRLCPDDGWLHYLNCRFRGRDYSRLLCWGLAITRGNDDPTKKNSGFWRPTKKGIAFVERRIMVPSHVYLYDNKVEGWSDKLVTIRQALGKRFDLEEIMRGRKGAA